MVDVICLNPDCLKTFAVTRPRQRNWTGEIRREVECPHCQGWSRTPLCPTGVENDQEPKIELLSLGDRQIAIEGYECSVGNARRFAFAFRRALDRLPERAKGAITEHWIDAAGPPHVWLLKDRSEWGGRGWAASSKSGRSLYFVSDLVGDIPDDLLNGFVTHELGHILFVALKEPNHVGASPDENILEWLVWQLMTSWGVDQAGMELWMAQHYEDDISGLRKREQALTEDEARQSSAVLLRSKREQEFSTRVFPIEYEPYLY